MSGNEKQIDDPAVNQMKKDQEDEVSEKKDALHSALCQGQMEYNRSCS